MFGISFEHILVLGIILLFVGPRRLPELGHTLGKAIKNFKDSVSGIEEASFRKIDENAPKLKTADSTTSTSTPHPGIPTSDTPVPETKTTDSSEKVAGTFSDEGFNDGKKPPQS